MKNYGYIEDEVLSDHYTLGAIQSEVLQANAQWTAFLPENEVQNKNGLESFNCTSYGSINLVEIYLRRKFRVVQNHSERYLGVLAKTTKAGNRPHYVLEVMRNYAGLIPESDLPFDESIETWEEYYSGVTFPLKLKGFSWLKQWELQHEWVLNGETSNWQSILIDSLRFSPVGVAVDAWHLGDGVFVRRGPDTHWCVIVGFVKDRYWIVYDSYEKNIKKLSWDFNFTRAKRIHLQERTSHDSKFVLRAVQGLLGLY